ncbi:hypothetical protein [Nocardioides sp. Soil805]|uniref:hypothetical protein n=1 Tax=Nocardioides sp. Soil805 TaxID=1736416 RepID=UPI0012E3C3DC|nr:hypothetical protein [Nocardioides sp. Soil805]
MYNASSEALYGGSTTARANSVVPLSTGRDMFGRTLKTLTAATATVALLSTGAAAASGHEATGPESFNGFLVKTNGSIDITRIAFHGAFDGVGRIIETGARPGDPDNVNRDNLVFADGTMHLLSTNNDVKFHLNPTTCRLSAWVQQTNQITGGTGIFRNSSGTFKGTVRAFGVFPRKANGRCKQTGELLHEVDLVDGHGHFTF